MASIDANNALSIRQDIGDGYNETLCIVCENSAGSEVKHPNWKIQQIRNCGTALVNATQANRHADVVIEYLNVTSDHVAATASIDFFTNDHVAFC